MTDMETFMAMLEVADIPFERHDDVIFITAANGHPRIFGFPWFYTTWTFVDGSLVSVGVWE